MLDYFLFNAFDLFLPDHVHRFMALDGVLGSRIRTKSEARLLSKNLLNGSGCCRIVLGVIIHDYYRDAA
jgi:hypothetical protein